MKHLAAAAWFCALAVVCSYPLALAPGSWIPGAGAGDNTMFLWNFWWMRQALQRSASPFFTPYLFAPFGTPLVLHTHTALEAMLGATLLRSLPLTAAHNVVLLAGMAANGVAAYALAFHHTRRTMPAVLAGTLFASSTYIAIHLLGHFNLVHAWVLPLAALTWILAVEHPTTGRCCATAAAFAAAAYSDYYYFAYAVMFALAWWFLGRWTIAIGGRRFPRVEQALSILAGVIGVLIMVIAVTGGFRFEFGGMSISASSIRNPSAALWLLLLAWVGLRCRVNAVGGSLPAPATFTSRGPILGLALFFVLIAPLALAAIRLFTSGGYVSPPLHWRTGARGIDVATMILGNPLHPWYGSMTRTFYGRMGVDLMEQVAWIGIVPIILLVAALSNRRASAASRRWLWMTGLFFVWSLGSFLIVGGIDTGLPLPQLLGRVTPILSNARMPGRAIVMVQLGLAVFCALQVAARGWRAPQTMMLVAVALVDTMALPYPMFGTRLASGVDERIRSSPSGIVLEVPFGVRDGFGTDGQFDHRAFVHQFVHGQPIAGGAVARLPMAVRHAYVTNPSFASLMSWPSRELPQNLAIDLRTSGVGYVVVNTDVAGPGIGNVLKERGLRLLMTDGARDLYAVE